MIALLWACSELPTAERPPVELSVFLEGSPKAGGGTLVVQADYDPSGELSLPEPVGFGPPIATEGGDDPSAIPRPGQAPAPSAARTGTLEFTADGAPVTERIGDRNVVTQRYVFRGKKGSYEIPPLVASWEGEGEEASTAESASVFVDLGDPPPREGMADIVEPAPPGTFPWAVTAVVGALVAGGLFVAFRPRRAASGPRPVAPDLAALRAWAKVRDDKTSSVDQKAQAVSRIFRDYTEAVLGFDATSSTTGELLDHLAGLRHLPDGNVPRARRLLRAADRVKFAEERPASEWVAELDSDLRAFIDSTKPSSWKREG